MAKWQTIARGTRARKSFDVILQSEDPKEDARTLKVDLVALDGEEEALVLQRAREFAAARGSLDPKDGDPLYELGHQVHTLALAVLDPDVIDKRDPVFASAEEVLKAHELGRDGIMYLYRAQKAWQAMSAPGRKIGESPTDYIERVSMIAGAKDADFFWQLAPVARESYLLFTAQMLLDLLTVKSLSGSDSEPDGTTSQPKKSDASDAP